MAARITDVEAEFWRRVDKSGDCWNWQGNVNTVTGYGTAMWRSLKEAGYPRLAHRLAWIFANGPIPDNILVCHKCDNRICCRPDHLFLGTYADNTHDSMNKGRFTQSSYSGKRMLTAEIVAEARRLARRMSVTRVAQILNVERNSIYCAITGRIWKHVSEPPVDRALIRQAAQIERDERKAAAQVARHATARAMRIEYATTDISMSGLALKYGQDIANVSRILNNKIHFDPDYVPSTSPKNIPAAPPEVKRAKARSKYVKKNADWGTLKDCEVFHIACPPDIEMKIREIAAQKNTKPSNVIRTILREHLFACEIREIAA